MTRVGLTQRVTVVEEYGERRDCLDQEWTSLLESEGYQPIPIPNTVNDVTTYLDELDFDAIILTSGNDLSHLDDATIPAPERDRFEMALLDWAIDTNTPVLGVCRGLELLNHYFGGSLTQVDKHVSNDHLVTFEIRVSDTSGVGLDLPDKITVNSYHEYGILQTDVGGELEVVSTAPDGTVECVRHPQYPLWGIMWHPERKTQSSEFDRRLFDYLFSSVSQ